MVTCQWTTVSLLTLSLVQSTCAGIPRDVRLQRSTNLDEGLDGILDNPGYPPLSTTAAELALLAINASGDVFSIATELVVAGFAPVEDVTCLLDVQTCFNTGANSDNNTNPIVDVNIYPQKGAGDAPFTIPEEDLRSAVYIPDNFTYGAVPPVLLVHGTGLHGELCFAPNFLSLFQGSAFADPIWVNVPGMLLDEVPTTVEYVAYAINYVSALSHQNISILAFSQGNLDTQWALTFWPSTRSVVSDFISISPDFQGSVIVNAQCDAQILLGIGCPPGYLQQTYESPVVEAFRAAGGASAWVPHTIVYSLTDDIVQPQTGDGASSPLGDARGVGVLNAAVQDVCAGAAAGGLYTHEGVLYHPLAAALAVDALTHDGPGDLSRIDLETVCGSYVSPEMGLDGILGTEEGFVIAALAIFQFSPNVYTQPTIPTYAQ